MTRHDNARRSGGPCCRTLFGGALLGLVAVASPVDAIVIATATPPDFAQSLVPAGQWQGVGEFTWENSDRSGSGALISARHVLTAAHIFFQGAGGTGDRVETLPVFRLAGFANPFTIANVAIPEGPNGYNSTLGHRGGGRDIAVVTLTNPVQGTAVYEINTGQIPDERVPTLETVKVGYGRAGNGTTGASAPPGQKRSMTNRVDQFGDGQTTYHIGGDRPEPPPVNTLVYDFDDPNVANSSNLRNFHDQTIIGATGGTEGSPARGDSGGPMFQRAGGGAWYLVGVTSSGSHSNSRFGNVAYDTRVRSYADWIRGAVPEPSSLLLLGLAGGALLASRRLRRPPSPAEEAPR